MSTSLLAAAVENKAISSTNARHNSRSGDGDSYSDLHWQSQPQLESHGKPSDFSSGYTNRSRTTGSGHHSDKTGTNHALDRYMSPREKRTRELLQGFRDLVGHSDELGGRESEVGGKLRHLDSGTDIGRQGEAHRAGRGQEARQYGYYDRSRRYDDTAGLVNGSGGGYAAQYNPKDSEDDTSDITFEDGLLMRGEGGDVTGESHDVSKSKREKEGRRESGWTGIDQRRGSSPPSYSKHYREAQRVMTADRSWVDRGSERDGNTENDIDRGREKNKGRHMDKVRDRNRDDKRDMDKNSDKDRIKDREKGGAVGTSGGREGHNRKTTSGQQSTSPMRRAPMTKAQKRLLYGDLSIDAVALDKPWTSLLRR